MPGNMGACKEKKTFGHLSSHLRTTRYWCGMAWDLVTDMTSFK